MVWDPVREVFVLHGGQDLNWDMRAETWEWSPKARDWRRVVAETREAPGMRIMHAMVFDSFTPRMILFGGMMGGTYFNDTWAFDGPTARWLRLETTGGPPAARSQHGMVYDPIGDQLVVFGGRDANIRPLHDTWLLDLTTLVWTQVDPDQKAPHPQARDHVQMARDPLSGAIVMRGCFLDNGLPDETWHLDAHAHSWSLARTNQEPRGMDHGFLCPVESLGGLVLFGFGGANASEAQTWLYRPQQEVWTLLGGAGEPPEVPCDHAQVASDGQHLFLLGGFLPAPPSSESGVIPRGATWRY